MKYKLGYYVGIIHGSVTRNLHNYYACYSLSGISSAWILFFMGLIQYSKLVQIFLFRLSLKLMAVVVCPDSTSGCAAGQSQLVWSGFSSKADLWLKFSSGAVVLSTWINTEKRPVFLSHAHLLICFWASLGGAEAVLTPGLTCPTLRRAK